jgi:hypothetical protein
MDDRVTFDRQVTGSRTFDYAKEGVAHYGLYADWFADLRRLGGERLRNDLWDGAEAYLEMWERASGVRTGCARSAPRLGASWASTLRRVGQPQTRDRDWVWCVRGGGNDVAVFGRDGRVAFVGSTARGRSAAGMRVGQRTSGSGLRVRGRAGYVVRGGRVVAVGRGANVRARLKRVLAARVRQARFVPRASAAQFAGRPLAATGSASTDAALTLLCGLLSAQSR